MLYITGEGIPLSASVYINKNYVKQQRAESGGRRCPVSGLGIRKGKERKISYDRSSRKIFQQIIPGR